MEFFFIGSYVDFYIIVCLKNCYVFVKIVDSFLWESFIKIIK